MEPIEAPEEGHPHEIESPEVTRLLLTWSGGDREALDRLIPVVFEELRQIARRQLEKEDPRHTLQPTALVHEAYMRLAERRQVHWQNRSHFFGFASQLMRRILVDHARSRQASKRGGGQRPVRLESLSDLAERQDREVILVDEALETLAAVDLRQARIVELRFFAGLSNEEISEVLGISATTVKREWRTARLWLLQEFLRG